jgi:pimeloyl-ACP methyl ester carboxylesterase
VSASPVLLVHGAWGGAWAWGYVQAELEQRGVTSVAIDLPSRNAAPSTMADDAAAVRATLDELAEPAVLVGHSYAGVVITEASAGNDKVSHLVYVCAILPQEGESTLALMGQDPTPSKLGAAVRVTEDGLSTVDPDGAKDELFNDVSQEHADPIIAGLGTHRMSVFGEAPTQLGWKEHPSTYIVTTEDRIFSPELQRRMATSATGVVSVDAGHVPLLSRPAELADAIAAAARRG